MNFRGYIGSLCIVFCIWSTNAQIVVTNNPPFDTEESLVTNILLGDGIEASNFSSVGFANGIGYFDGFNANIGFEEGLILSTGGLTFVTDGFGVGSGVSGDDDLVDALSAIGMTGFSVNNVTILEFDFVAQSENMAFNYVFGSMEYTSYTCSQFNDIFGFFLSGPGIAGPYTNDAVNIALVPDPEGAVDYDDWLANNTGLYTNTPVAINTINDGEMTNDPDCNSIDPNFEDYNIFWYDNDYGVVEGVNQPPDPEFTVAGLTGFTTPLTAVYSGLTCGETYHIKLAIADCWDSALNSAVFLEANSFASPEVEISTVPNADLGLVLGVDNGVLEGCGQVAIQFDRGGDLSMDLEVTIEYSGDATYGVDYADLPTELTLPAFEEQIIIPIDVFFDNISENPETLIATISGVPVPCQEAEVQAIEIILFDQEELLLDMPDLINMDCLGSATIDALISGGYAPYEYTWYNESGDVVDVGVLDGEGVVSINQAPTENTYYTLVVTDDCMDQLVTSSTDVVIDDQPLSVSLVEDMLICEDELASVVLNPDIIGGLPNYNYTWFYDGVVISNDPILLSPPGEGLYQLVVEEACGALAGDEVMITFIDLEPYVELISYDVLDPTLLPEGCFESVLQFNVPEIQDEDINLEFFVNGSAELGIDYNVDTDITIPAGEDVFFIPVSIALDQLEEGVETIEFNFPFIDACSNWPTTLTIQIYEPPPLFVELDDELILCEDEVDVGFLEGFYNGGVGIVNYGWHYNDELISSELNLSTDGLETGIYSFIAIDQCDNISVASINFDIIFEAPIVTLSSSYYNDPSELYEGCGNSILTFDMPYPYNADTVFYYNIIGPSSFINGGDIDQLPGYIDVPAGVTSVNVSINPLLDSSIEGVETIIFEFPFSNDCFPQNDIVVNINNYYPIEISVPPDQNLCTGQSLYLEAEYMGGMPPYTTSWEYLNESSNSSSIVFDVEEGVFPATFTVIDDCGFSSSSVVLVDGNEVESFEVIWPPNEVLACYGDNSEIYLALEGGLPPFSFEWTLDGIPTTAPTSSLPWNDDYWIPGSNQMIATTPPYTPYEYEYEVLVTDSCGQTDLHQITVTVEDCMLPTSFTPNGDNNNDVFWVNLGELIGPVSLDVFNRWGNLVFRSRDYRSCVSGRSDCWDGTYFKEPGQLCSEGVYYYVFTYSDPIYNADPYDVSGFNEAIFGGPHDRNEGTHRTGSLLLVR